MANNVQGNELARVPMWRRVAVVLIAWPLAAFFGFVGWHKSFASLAELATYHAWTARVPEWIGRPVGWMEIACATALLASVSMRAWPVARWLALAVASTQIVSTAIHIQHDELGFIGQNVVLGLGLLAVFWLTRPSVAVTGNGQ